jgi:molybdenum cofactor cytidylyltransferase
MKFRRLPLARANGHILGHNVSYEGRRVLKKGRKLTEVELAELARAGLDSVYVAELEATDVGEDAAAERLGAALAERAGLRLELAYGGRVSLLAPAHGVLSIDGELLLELNLIEGVTLATPANHEVLVVGQSAGTLKIIPFALAAARLESALQLVERGVMAFRPLGPRRVRILVGGSEGRRERLLETYRRPLELRLSELGSKDVQVEYVPFDRDPERSLASAFERQFASGAELLIVVGETATMDKEDLIPQAIRRAGGEVKVVGAPVFPGNLLLLGYCQGTAILGAPGCARSRARNVVDLLLPRLLTGERPGPREIAALGLGGLLERGGPQKGAGQGDGDG